MRQLAISLEGAHQDVRFTLHTGYVFEVISGYEIINRTDNFSTRCLLDGSGWASSVEEGASDGAWPDRQRSDRVTE